MRYRKPNRLPHEAYDDRDAVFHVIVSALPGEAPFRDRTLGDTVWRVVEGELERPAVRLAAACLMPDHLHLVVSPEEKTLIRWMNDFKSYTTHLSKGIRGRRFLWQRSFYDRKLRADGEFETAVHYVTRNPVTAGLVEEALDWPWVGAWTE